MKLRLILLLFWIGALGAMALAQAPSIIEKAEISGIPEDRLSAALRAEIQTLAGKTYDEKSAGQLAERIQSELPAFVATPTTSPGSQPNSVRLIFTVAQNINAKYTVEAVEAKGFEKAKLSEGLRADLDKLVGHPVDDAEADRIRDLIGGELKNHHMRRSVERGQQAQHVKIIYEAPSENSISGTFNQAGYHSRQKFSALVNASYTRLDSYGVHFQAVNVADPLIERYAGFRYGPFFKYKRIRLSADYSSFRSQWSSDTLYAASNASAGSPTLYRLRDTAEASAKITITSAISATVGVDSTLLQLQSPALHFVTTRAAKGKLEYSHSTSSKRHEFSGSYDIHVAGDVLGGSQSYTRHEFGQSYTFKPNGSSDPSPFAMPRGFSFGLSLGRITGDAPMFERFSLGNNETLVGWNKYEISPLGGSRMAHASATYNHKYFEVSYYAGSVWDAGKANVVRNSISAKPRLGSIMNLPNPIRIILNIVSPEIGIPLTNSNAHPTIGIGGGS